MDLYVVTLRLLAFLEMGFLCGVVSILLVRTWAMPHLRHLRGVLPGLLLVVGITIEGVLWGRFDLHSGNWRLYTLLAGYLLMDVGLFYFLRNIQLGAHPLDAEGHDAIMEALGAIQRRLDALEGRAATPPGAGEG